MRPTGSSSSMPLAAGAVWRGCQKSGQARYDVEVRIYSVDERGDISGTLTIRNLTPSLPKLVTYFDGEVIGNYHSFTTDKWGASQEDDDAHWGRFKRDLYLRGHTEVSDCDAIESLEDIVFMRLKERCILNSDGQADLSGASFAGFYYIAVELNPASSAESAKPKSLYSVARSDYRLEPSEAVNQSALTGSSRHPASPTLTRSDSYASIVRGRSPVPTPIRITTNSTSISKTDDSVLVTVGSATSTVMGAEDVYSPPIEEFPLPSSPRSSGCQFEARGLSSICARRTDSPACRDSGDRHLRSRAATNSHFYNSQTGYSGPWSQAVMNGFYFASSTDPYQELELHYVGDGMGALLEENEEEKCGMDEWGFIKPVDQSSSIKREFARRERYLQTRGSASFTVL